MPWDLAFSLENLPFGWTWKLICLRNSFFVPCHPHSACDYALLPSPFHKTAFGDFWWIPLPLDNGVRQQRVWELQVGPALHSSGWRFLVSHAWGMPPASNQEALQINYWVQLAHTWERQPAFQNDTLGEVIQELWLDFQGRKVSGFHPDTICTLKVPYINGY